MPKRRAMILIQLLLVVIDIPCIVIALFLFLTWRSRKLWLELAKPVRTEIFVLPSFLLTGCFSLLLLQEVKLLVADYSPHLIILYQALQFIIDLPFFLMSLIVICELIRIPKLGRILWANCADNKKVCLLCPLSLFLFR
jgi:hypothetical protein